MRARADFHRYGGAYFWRRVSDGSWQSTYDFDRSKRGATEPMDSDAATASRYALSNGTAVIGK